MTLSLDQISLQFYRKSDNIQTGMHDKSWNFHYNYHNHY